MNSDEKAKRWLGKLTRLNPASGRGECRGKAPHKPLLLLSLLDMAGAGEVPAPAFTRSAGLLLRFRSYGAIVSERWPTRLDIRMPFFHLSRQGFWEPYDADRRPAGSPETCAVCELHPEFFELLADPGFRLNARLVIVSKYFEPAERIALFESLGLESDDRNATRTERVLAEATEAAKRKGRSALLGPRRLRILLHLRAHRIPLPDGRRRDHCGRRPH